MALELRRPVPELALPVVAPRLNGAVRHDRKTGAVAAGNGTNTCESARHRVQTLERRAVIRGARHVPAPPPDGTVGPHSQGGGRTCHDRGSDALAGDGGGGRGDATLRCPIFPAARLQFVIARDDRPAGRY